MSKENIIHSIMNEREKENVKQMFAVRLPQKLRLEFKKLATSLKISEAKLAVHMVKDFIEDCKEELESNKKRYKSHM